MKIRKNLPMNDVFQVSLKWIINILILYIILVLLYSHEKIDFENLMGFAALILSLGVVRTLAVVYSPDAEEPGDE